MPTPREVTAIDRVIRAHLKELRKPGAILVRPGFRIAGERITGERAIVVTVDRKLKSIKAKDRLPATIGGIAVDVREATGLQRLRKAAPAKHAVAAVHVRESDKDPAWPLERTLPDGKLLTAKPAPKAAAVTAVATKPQVKYTPAPVPLAAVTRRMTLVACASPDAGYTVLADFFAATRKSLTVGMYDFTSGMLLKSLDAVLKGGGKSFMMTLCHPPLDRTANQTDEQTVAAIHKADRTAKVAWALVRNDPLAARWIYPSAYHIKVAVRDHNTFWLSSGNWNVANQPWLAGNKKSTGLLASSDRDWHVVVQDEGLARLFEAYLEHDFAVASKYQAPPVKAAKAKAAVKAATDAHVAQQAKGSPKRRGTSAPDVPFTLGLPKTFTDTITVQPVLTPDRGEHGTMYVDHVLALIDSARKQISVQLAYIHPTWASQDRDFQRLIDALAAAIKRGVVVRIINGQYENTPQFLELMHEAGLSDVLRLQENVHNKGIVVDSSAVLVSSQNWSSAGVLQNRDAGLIIHHAGIAQYFEAIFQQDWDHRARPVT